ncbi:lysine 5,6-aminomutase reactivase subunit KamB [Tepidibacter aestuarii]|uniref:lysine 5,6-aminomutase reactivase subunit KamB n=1 Tax=Tepidibacter aestuarii TaxID=2925782 RepID=UPI0020BE3562|nr:hypothetical protein [Tepidibacter aestuarii]CAH2214244.1 conserved protein of unknown function [Tepidibacter aestuarii]
MKNLIKTLKNYNSISIIGMDKNVGKTTTLNYILSKTKGKTTLGLTSIGRDGEEKDVVTSTHKPQIYISKGTFIATSKMCFLSSDVTKEILNTTGINTPMGQVILFKSLSDGYIELAGASSNKDIKTICDSLIKLGAELVLVDGALSRKTFASPSITDATILCTGACVSKSMNDVVNKTVHTVKTLSLGMEEDKNILKTANSISKVGIIYKNLEFKDLNLLTSIDSSKYIVQNLNESATHIVIKGLLLDKLIQDIMKSTDLYNGITILIQDATKSFVSESTMYRFLKTGGSIKVINKINLIGISVNPKSIYGYEFDKNKFLQKIRTQVELPVFDVIGGG